MFEFSTIAEGIDEKLRNEKFSSNCKVTLSKVDQRARFFAFEVNTYEELYS